MSSVSLNEHCFSLWKISISYYPVIKNSNPFTPSKSLIELIKKNLCTNFILTQSKVRIIKLFLRDFIFISVCLWSSIRCIRSIKIPKYYSSWLQYNINARTNTWWSSIINCWLFNWYSSLSKSYSTDINRNDWTIEIISMLLRVIFSNE